MTRRKACEHSHRKHSSVCWFSNSSTDRTRAIFLKDPTGFFVEVVQPDPLPETTAPANSNIIGARLGVTVKDVEETARFYQGILGFQPKTDPAFVADRAMTDAAGLSGAQ